MKNYTKVYMKYFGYGIDDYIACEVCDNRAVDIHHINARGMGGTKNKESIEEIMALCRQCHIDFGDKEQYMEFLKDKHNEIIR
jgi:5-methylcytosine-specific restriction endonuclease McrA